VFTVRSAVVEAPDPYEAFEGRLRESIRSLGLGRARIGHERSFEAVAPGHFAGEVLVPSDLTHGMIARAAPDATLVDAAPMLNDARARKTPREIAKLRLANRVAGFGLEAFTEHFEPGRTEADVAAQVEATIMARGTGFDAASRVRAWAHLMSGPESWRAYSLHPASSARIIQSGDLGVLELGTQVDGYWSDLTRTLVAGGAPSSRQSEMYDAISTAHAAVMTGARPGMTGGEVDALCRGEIERRGFGRCFVHPTGHGLGFRYHEPQPLLRPGNQDIVKEGMVSSIEPGLYIEGFGGMRQEENVIFTSTGVEVL
jgi:Xaa-Pro dipeptidase